MLDEWQISFMYAVETQSPRPALFLHAVGKYVSFLCSLL